LTEKNYSPIMLAIETANLQVFELLIEDERISIL